MANTFSGNVSVIKDPERRGDKLVTCSVMDKPYSKNNDADPLFITAKFWDKTASIVEQHIKKGKQIFISGQLRNNNYNDKNYLEINVDRMEFINTGGESPERKKQTTKSNNTTKKQEVEDGSDIPF